MTADSLPSTPASVDARTKRIARRRHRRNLRLGAGAVAVLLLAAYGIWSGWALSLLFRRRPGDVPRAVVSLIAAVSLYDAVLIAGAGGGWLALPAVAAFAATLALQRLVPGT